MSDHWPWTKSWKRQAPKPGQVYDTIGADPEPTVKQALEQQENMQERAAARRAMRAIDRARNVG